MLRTLLRPIERQASLRRSTKLTSYARAQSPSGLRFPGTRSLFVRPSTPAVWKRWLSAVPKRITLDELEMHSNSNDCWIAIRGKVCTSLCDGHGLDRSNSTQVYDVTDFVYEHPGGDVILDGAGIDATEMFDGALEFATTIVSWQWL